MRFNILSIEPIIINVSTQEEDNFIISKTIVHYEVFQTNKPILKMKISSEFEGTPTIATIIHFIRNEHEHPSLTK